MSEATIRQMIVDALNTVTDIGMVHNYERWAVLWPKQLELFKCQVGGKDTYRGWTVACSAIRPLAYLGFDEATARAVVFRSYTFKVRGYIAMRDQDESELAAIQLAESVLNALDHSEDLHAGDETVNKFQGASLDIFEHRKLGEVLCHYAEITAEGKELAAA